LIGPVGTAAFAYLLAWYLNRRLLWLSRLMLPPSLLAGAALLLLSPQFRDYHATEWIPVEYYDSYRVWPGILISFLFSGMILEPAPRKAKTGLAVISQSLYVWLVAFVQLAWGYTVVWLFTSEIADRLFASTIELSFLGGHGAASAFYTVAERLGNREAADLSLAAATAGMLFGFAGGLLLVAFHRRYDQYGIGLFQKRHTAYSEEWNSEEVGTASKKPVNTEDQEEYRFLISFVMPVIPVFFAHLIVELLTDLLPAVKDLPLFFFAILMAHALKKIFQPFLNITAVAAFHRLALEALILSAAATVSVQAVVSHAGLLALLCAGAAILSVLLHLFIAPRLLPEYPDLALINFGMSTGTTAVGLALLRSLRHSLPVRPVQIYGLAAPFSSPFIGGGILSLLVFPELSMHLPPPVMLVITVACAILTICLSLLLRRFQRG
jgi:ESS family glutamate:Na+ symporter